jgi:hypothetical protein
MHPVFVSVVVGLAHAEGTPVGTVVPIYGNIRMFTAEPEPAVTARSLTVHVVGLVGGLSGNTPTGVDAEFTDTE